MDIKNELYKRYGNQAYLYAYGEDPKGMEDDTRRIQECYVQGGYESPVLTWEPQPHHLTQEEQVTQAVEDLRGKVEERCRASFVRRYSRREAEILVALLCKADYEPRVTIIEDITMCPHDIASLWSELHPDEDPIYAPGPDLG